METEDHSQPGIDTSLAIELPTIFVPWHPIAMGSMNWFADV
jgi:hypothetical protein